MPSHEPLNDAAIDQIFAADKNDQNNKWTMSEAILLIESFVVENESLEEVNKHFFSKISIETIDQRDVDFIERVYFSTFWAQIPDKANLFINNVITEATKEEIMKWIFVIYGNKSNEQLIELFQKSPFFDTLNAIFKKNDASENDFCQKIRKHFCIAFVETQHFHGLLGIYRCLLYCNSKTKRSKTFCLAVTNLWKKLFGENEVLKLEEENEVAHIEHNLLEKLVADYELETDISNLIFIKSKIEKMFESIKFRTFFENGELVFEVYGRIIVWSEIVEEFKKKYDSNKVGQIRISAMQEIILNENLDFPEKNLSIISQKLVIPLEICINLSGNDAKEDEKLSNPAKSGVNDGENGKNGEDGIAGGSSGNLAICVPGIINEENLTIKLNGGKGAKGQDGGNGANGKDGIGEKFNDKFNGWDKSLKYIATTGNAIYGGLPVRITKGFETIKQPNGVIHKSSTSNYIIVFTHCFSYYEGTKGSPGGKGGKNGNGGEGGKKGNITILKKSGDKNTQKSKIEACDGEYGENGKPGNNGEYGKDGWDIGVTLKALEKMKEFGRDHNEKIKIEYTNKYSKDTIYIGDRDTGDGSYCYAKITTELCTNRILRENEKSGERKSNVERKSDAISRKMNAININAVRWRYEELCLETPEQNQETSKENENKSEPHINRIAETFDIPKQASYVPKKIKKVPEINFLEACETNNPETWKKLWNGITSVTKLNELFEKVPSNLKENLSIKMLLAKLRFETNASWSNPTNPADSAHITSIQIQEMTKNLENENRNCSPFLINTSNEMLDVCGGALMGDSIYSEVIKNGVNNILAEMISAEEYEKYFQLFKEMDNIEVTGMPLSKLRKEFMKETKISEEDKNQIRSCICSVINSNENYQKFISDIEDDKNKIISVYNQVYEKILANQVLAEALRLIATTQVTEIELDKNPELFGEDALTENWLQNANNKERCNNLIEILLEYGKKCAGGRLILAWETQVNLRIYNNGYLIEDHMPQITENVQHFAIDENTGNFTPLELYQDRIILENERNEQTNLFKKRLTELESEYTCPIMLPQEYITTAQFCSFCKKQEEGKLSMDQIGVLKEKLELLLSFIDGKILFDKLEVMCIEFPTLGIAFINALINVFKVDGCHIDFFTFKYLLETSFVSFLTHVVQDKYFFPMIIFSFKQSEWMYEFFKFNAENALMTPIFNAYELRKRIREVKDGNLIVLCTNKLQDEKITSDSLLEIVAVMKDAYGAYTELIEINLDKWPSVIRSSQTYYKINSLNYKFVNEKQRNLSLFWCYKLADAKFEIEIIEELFAFLSKQKHIEDCRKACSLAIQRLCRNEIVAGEPEEERLNPVKIIKHIFSNSHETSIVGSDKEIIQELSENTRKKYKCEEFIKLSLKLNKSSEILSICFNKIRNHMALKKSIDGAIIACAEMALNKKYSKPSDFVKAFHEQCNYFSNIDFDIFLILIIGTVIKMKRGYYLRFNQIVAALCAVKSDTGILQQLATGEGKSLIITIVSIISVFKGYHVNIVTTSSTLAKRDTECPAPVGCLDIYEVFGIKASHICVDSPLLRSQRYAENDILYGDLTSFQRDYLLDKFYSMNIIGNRKYDIVIVDEVDSMLLDQSSNMLYLSHEIPDLELLQPLFVKIWQTVNGMLENSFYGFNEEIIYLSIYRSIFPMFFLQHFGSMLGISEDETKQFIDILIKENVINNEGAILITDKTKLLKIVEKFESIPKSTITRFIYSYDRVMDESRFNIPHNLAEFVKRHLKEFILNAKTAYFMEEGVEYQVDLVRSEGALSYQHKIIIIDQSTGADLPTTHWNNGLHQFLQMKHAIRLTAISLKAVFTSNVSFLKMFGSIYGFSGTLGADAERAQLSQVYKLECLTLPSQSPKKFYEEPSIVANKNVLVIDDNESHAFHVFNVLCEKMNEGRSVLVICESIKQVTNLSEDIKNIASKRLPNEALPPFNTALLYRREHEKFAYADGTSLLEPKKIIFSTNLAGRGTDIRLTEELKNNGGLHVIVANLPENLRIEEQAFGRAARCGDEGTAQLIICGKSGHNINILKTKRNAEEILRIQKITEFYNDKIRVEEECFEHFTTAFKTKKEKYDKLYVDEERNKLFLRDLLDQWALWLDKIKFNNLNAMERIEAAKEYCTQISEELTQPMNIIRYGILEAIAKNYLKALKCFETIVKMKDVYSAEAKYYLAFVYIKFKTQDYMKIMNLMEEARNEFEHRFFGYNNDRAIIEHYRKNEISRIFNADGFSQQQLELAQLMNLFIESIDGVIGRRIEKNTFMTALISEEVSYLLHQYFSSAQLFQNPPITQIRRKKYYEIENLKHFCQQRGISFKKVTEKLESFKNQNVDEKELTEVMNPVTTEKFWDELKKKGLIWDVKEHAFVNTTKYMTLNPELAKIIQTYEIEKPEEIENSDVPGNQRIFQYSFVKESNWKELKLELVKSDGFWKEVKTKIPENIFNKNCLEILLEIGAVCFTESAEFIEKNETETLNIVFDKFSTVSKEDFLLHGLPETEIENIFKILIETKLLMHNSDGTYKLADASINQDQKATKEENQLFMSQKSLKIPNCFESLVQDILKQKLAFVLCYRNLQHDLKEKLNLKIPFPTFQESSPIFDLYNIGIFERSNVDLKALSQEQNFLVTNPNQALYNNVMNNETSYNISKAAELIAIICENNVKTEEEYSKMMELLNGRYIVKNIPVINQTINGLMIEKVADKLIKDQIKHYAEVMNKVAKQKYENNFIQNAPANQKFESLDAKLISLWDKLSECNLVELRSSCMMITHGATHLICLKEEQWSKGTKIKLAVVFGAAVAQLVVGNVVLICSCGSGVFVADFLISEGISDMIYCVKGLYTGYADNYKQHKIMSMVGSGILCGVGGRIAKEGQFNSVAYGIYGPKWASAGINHAALKGSELTSKVALKHVVKEAATQICKKVASAVLNFGLFTALEYSLKSALDETIKCVREKIMQSVDDVFETLEDLSTLIKDVLTLLGIENGKKMISECANHVIHGKTSHLLNDICDFVFVKYKHLFLNFGNGIAQGLNHMEDSAAAKVRLIMKIIEKGFLMAQFVELAVSLYNKLKSYMKDIELMIKTNFEKRKLTMTTEEPPPLEESDKIALEKEVTQIIEEWKNEMSNYIDKALEIRVAMPLLSLATSAIQKQLEAMISKGYAAVKEKLDKKKFEKYTAEFEAKKNAGNEEEIKEAKKDYYNKLEKLQSITRSPAIYAKCIIAGVKIDQTGASAVANLLSGLLGVPVRMNITNEKGETFTHSSGEGNENVKVINIDLAGQHFSSEKSNEINVISNSNSCLYDAIKAEVPELESIFKSEDSFRHGLAHVLTKDRYFKQHIKNGWHSIAIDKGLIGGKIIPKSKNEEMTHEEFLDYYYNDFKKIIAEDKQKIVIETNYNTMMSEFEKLPNRIQHIFRNLVLLDPMITKKLQELKEAIAEVQGLEKAGHDNRYELMERQKKAQNVLNIAKRILGELKEAERRIYYPNDVENNGRNITALLKELGGENSLRTPFVFPIIKLDAPQNRKICEKVYDWQNSQEPYASLDTRNKLLNAHIYGEQIELTKKQKVLIAVSRTMQNQVGILYPPEQPLTEHQQDRHLHTFAAGIIPSDKSTVYVAANYFNNITGQPLTRRQQKKLIKTAITLHRSELNEIGITKVQFLNRNTDILPNRTKDFYNDDGTFNLEKGKIFRNFYHSTHVEIFFSAFERQQSVLNRRPAYYSLISLGSGKPSCINCQAILDHQQISHPVDPGQVQTHNPRYMHPNDIKVKRGVWGNVNQDKR